MTPVTESLGPGTVMTLVLHNGEAKPRLAKPPHACAPSCRNSIAAHPRYALPQASQTIVSSHPSQRNSRPPSGGMPPNWPNHYVSIPPTEDTVWWNHPRWTYSTNQLNCSPSWINSLVALSSVSQTLSSQTTTCLHPKSDKQPREPVPELTNQLHTSTHSLRSSLADLPSVTQSPSQLTMCTCIPLAQKPAWRAHLWQSHTTTTTAHFHSLGH